MIYVLYNTFGLFAGFGHECKSRTLKLPPQLIWNKERSLIWTRLQNKEEIGGSERNQSTTNSKHTESYISHDSTWKPVHKVSCLQNSPSFWERFQPNRKDVFIASAPSCQELWPNRHNHRDVAWRACQACASTAAFKVSLRIFGLTAVSSTDRFQLSHGCCITSNSSHMKAHFQSSSISDADRCYSHANIASS